MKRRILSSMLAFSMILSMFQTAALAADTTSEMNTSGEVNPPESIPVDNSEHPTEPQPQSTTSVTPQVEAGKIAITDTVVYANGVPIVIKENVLITSIYAADGTTLLSGVTDVSGLFIYGGGSTGDHTGDTNITLESGTVGTIFGGNQNEGTITGNTNITINGGNVGSIYGGNYYGGAVTGDTNITINNGTITGWVYGGGSKNTEVKGTANITLNNGSVAKNIYGGGWGSKSIVANSNISLKGGSVGYNVFGGGSNETSVGTATIIIDGFNSPDTYIFGGGAGYNLKTTATVENAVVQMKSGSVQQINGNGPDFEGKTTTKNISISLEGGTRVDEKLSLVFKDNAQFGGENSTLDIKISNKNVDLYIGYDTLPKFTNSKLTYENVGDDESWRNYDTTTSTNNPYIKGSDYVSSKNKLTELVLINSYVDFEEVDSTSSKPCDLNAITEKLTIDCGMYRHKQANLNTEFPATVLLNDPLIYFTQVALADVNENGDASFSNGISGKARVQLMDMDGNKNTDPLGGNKIMTYGSSGVTLFAVPTKYTVPIDTFTLESTAASTAANHCMETGNMQVGDVTKTAWSICDTSVCKCSVPLNTQPLLSNIFTMKKDSSSTVTLKTRFDGTDSSQGTADCKIIGHQDYEYAVTYELITDGTTAPGAVIADNQLTVTGTGAVKVKVTATLGIKSDTKTTTVSFFARDQADDFFSKNEASSSNKDIVLTYNGPITLHDLFYKVPGGSNVQVLFSKGQFTRVQNAETGEWTLTIKKDYLNTLDPREYEFFISYIVSGNTMKYDYFNVTVSDAKKSTLEIAPSKTENVVYGDEITYTATVASGETGDTQTPTGTVQFKVNDVDYGEALALDAATITLDHTKLKAGDQVVTAVYSGDADYTSVTSTATTTIAKSPLVLTPNNVEIYTNAVLPTPTFEYVGLIGEDVGAEVAIPTETLVMEIRNVDDTDILADSKTNGTYKIKFKGTPTFNVADNYEITTAEGSLTIKSAPSGGGGSSKPKPDPKPPVIDGDNTIVEVPVKPSVDGGNATITVPDSTVNDAIDKVVEDAKENNKKPVVEITVDTNKDVDSVETVISGDSLGNIADNDADLVISSDVATVTIPSDVAKNIADKADGKKVEIKLNKTQELTDPQKAILGNNINTTPTLQVSVVIDNKKISEFGSDITITIPYTKSADVNLEDLVIWYIADDGKITVIDGQITDKTATFKTNHNSVYAIAQFPFTDVQNGSWYYDSAAFVFANEIMSGTTDTTFASNTTVTRAMLVTMLHRMSGEESVDYAMNFTDVDKNAYYAESVRWAVSKDIVTGVSDTEFAPNAVLTREQMVTMMWRYKGSPVLADYQGLTKYTDVSDISSFAQQAFTWAHEQKIISGKTDETLAPKGIATRAEIAVVIQRFMAIN